MLLKHLVRILITVPSLMVHEKIHDIRTFRQQTFGRIYGTMFVAVL